MRLSLQEVKKDFRNYDISGFSHPGGWALHVDSCKFLATLIRKYHLKNVLEFGSGFSSLAASCYMSKMGYDVTVLEKNNTIGGRARQIKREGFIFDIGPSWYWMPDVFEKYFNDFNKKSVSSCWPWVCC